MGGEVAGALTPTVVLLPSTALGTRLWREESFAPLRGLAIADDARHAVALANDSPFGLQAGVFTRDIQIAFRAHRELAVGGVIIGDVPTFRSDQMPYGGVKASGVGKEGLRWAMQDLTHERIMVFSGVDL